MPMVPMEIYIVQPPEIPGDRGVANTKNRMNSPKPETQRQRSSWFFRSNATSISVDEQQGFENFTNEQTDLAIANFKKAADAKKLSAAGMNQLAISLEQKARDLLLSQRNTNRNENRNNEEVESLLTDAFKWYQEAAKKGSNEAKYNLGYFLLRFGRAIMPNQEQAQIELQARELLKQAAISRSSDGKYLYDVDQNLAMDIHILKNNSKWLIRAQGVGNPRALTLAANNQYRNMINGTATEFKAAADEADKLYTKASGSGGQEYVPALLCRAALYDSVIKFYGTEARNFPELKTRAKQALNSILSLPNGKLYGYLEYTANLLVSYVNMFIKDNNNEIALLAAVKALELCRHYMKGKEYLLNNDENRVNPIFSELSALVGKLKSKSTERSAADNAAIVQHYIDAVKFGSFVDTEPAINILLQQLADIMNLDDIEAAKALIISWYEIISRSEEPPPKELDNIEVRDIILKLAQLGLRLGDLKDISTAFIITQQLETQLSDSVFKLLPKDPVYFDIITDAICTEGGVVMSRKVVDMINEKSLAQGSRNVILNAGSLRPQIPAVGNDLHNGQIDIEKLYPVNVLWDLLHYLYVEGNTDISSFPGFRDKDGKVFATPVVTPDGNLISKSTATTTVGRTKYQLRGDVADLIIQHVESAVAVVTAASGREPTPPKPKPKPKPKPTT